MRSISATGKNLGLVLGLAGLLQGCGAHPTAGTGSRDSAIWAPEYLPGGTASMPGENSWSTSPGSPGTNLPLDPPNEILEMLNAATILAGCTNLSVSDIAQDSDFTAAAATSFCTSLTAIEFTAGVNDAKAGVDL